jgi:hypothetical protein
LLPIPAIYTQNSEKEIYSFSKLKLESKLVFPSNMDSLKITINKDRGFSFLKENVGNYVFDSKALNERLFSNINIIENTYKNNRDFFRLCGPLDNGIVNTVNSGDEMLSNILNNFVNNVLFDGRGPITRLFLSKN